MAQSEAQSTVEKWWDKSQKHINSNDALVTLCVKAFETTAIVLSPSSDKACIDLAITSLHNDRMLVSQFEKEGVDVLRHLSFGLIETLQVLLEDKGKNIDNQKQTVVDVDFGVNNYTLPIEQPLNELPSSDTQSHKKIVHSDMMGDDMNSMEDPMIGESNDLMEDTTVHRTTDITKDSSESGGVEKKKRPSRTPSRHVKYTDSDEELEPLEKKPRIKTEQKMDNKRKFDVDGSPSNSSTKGFRVAKINDTELECPNCEYRSRSVVAWIKHLNTIHSTTPRQLGLALLCECGDESFSDLHNRKCEISKITVVRKTPTPKCMMCEMYPKTARGYACHLRDHHKTSLIQLGIFLVCSCGHEVRCDIYRREHTKRCNGRDYRLHIMDVE